MTRNSLLTMHVRDGELCPKRYGIVRSEFHRRGVIVALIPINVLLRIEHLVYQWLRNGVFQKDKWDEQLRDARHDGFSRGYDLGKGNGYKDALADIKGIRGKP